MSDVEAKDSNQALEVHPVSDVFIDDGGKLNEETFADGHRLDLDRVVTELDQLEAEQMSSVGVWEYLLNIRFPVSFTTPKTLVLSVGIFASFAGILSGLDQSIISGATPGLKAALHPNSNQLSLISSLMPLGGMAGSMLMIPLNHYLGRRLAIVASCLSYTLGGGLCAGCRSVHMLYAGRFCLGIGIGLEGGCVNIYISECVPPHLRGNLCSMYQFMLAFGELMGYACCAIFFEVHGGWRFMLGSTLVFSTILIIGLFMLPESPRWLVSKNKVGRAWNVWKSLRDINEPSSLIEFLEMKNTAELEEREAKDEKVWERYLELVTIPRNRRALIYAMVMVMLGQMTGINAVLYNMSNLLSKMNFDDRQSVLMSMVGGGALFIGTIPAILVMDRFGRRAFSHTIVFFFIGLVLVGAGYEINYDTHKAAALGVYFTGMILYMGFFGSYACLTCVIPAESFNLRTRAQGMAICIGSMDLYSFIVTYNFDRMQKAMTYTGLTIGFFGGIAFLGFFYQLLFMPETKDKTLEEIDDIFSMRTYELVKMNIRNSLDSLKWLVGKRSTSVSHGVSRRSNSSIETSEKNSSSAQKSYE